MENMMTLRPVYHALAQDKVEEKRLALAKADAVFNACMFAFSQDASYKEGLDIASSTLCTAEWDYKQAVEEEADLRA